MFIPSTTSAGAAVSLATAANKLAERAEASMTTETLKEAGTYFEVVKPYVWGLAALGAFALVENIALLFCCFARRNSRNKKDAQEKLRQQEAQAVEQLRQERERYNLILAREQRDRGDRRAAASTKPSVLPKNYLGRPPSPEELHQKRQARKSSNGSEADVSSGSLPLRPSIHSVAKKSTLAMASAFGKQASRPKATDSPVIDRYYQQQQGAGRPRASTLNAIDNWAQPVPPAAQTRQQQLKAYDSPSAYSQVSQSTYATDLSVNASRGREKLIKAVRQ